MADKRNIDGVIADAERLIQVMTENPGLILGSLTLEVVQADLTKLLNFKKNRDQTRVLLTKLIDDANDQAKLVNSHVTRGRSAIKGIFGPDSAQYDQVGGTRASARKPRSSKKSPAPQA
jgi:hypothetical protein